MNNAIKTTLLLTGLTFLLLLFGQAAGGRSGMMFAFIFACIMNFGAYWFSDQIVLKMYRAQPVAEADAPELYEMVQELTRDAGLPMPKLFIVPGKTANAFATGRNPSHAVIAVTQGIVNILNKEELRGVLAHELGHVKHRDILICSIAATLAGAIGMLASMARWSFFLGNRHQSRGSNPFVLILMAILMPIAAMLIQMAVSRSREIEADREGAELCGNPLYLASALRKLESAAGKLPLSNANPATAHLFIVNPLTGGGFAKLFSTHPPIEERIAKLEEMARLKGF